MKKILIILLIAITPAMSIAQSKSIKKFCDKYEDTADAFSLNFSGNIGGSYFTDNVIIKGDGAEKLEKYFKNFNLLSVQKKEVADMGRSIRELIRNMRGEDFEEYMDFRSKDDHISIMVQESKGKVWELALLVDEDESFTLLSFKTDISRKEFDKIMDGVDVNFD